MATLCAARLLLKSDIVGMGHNGERHEWRMNPPTPLGSHTHNWEDLLYTPSQTMRPSSLPFSEDPSVASAIVLPPPVNPNVTPQASWPAEREPCDQSEASARGPISRNNSSRYKTELCRPFMETGTCRYGEKCQFAHGLDEKRVIERHPKYKTEQCRTYHKDGFCPYGTRCHFVHKDAESQMRDEANAGTPPTGRAPPMKADSLGATAAGTPTGKPRAFSGDFHSASPVTRKPYILGQPGQSSNSPRNPSRSGRTPPSPALPNAAADMPMARYYCTEPSHLGLACSCMSREPVRRFSDASQSARPRTQGSPPAPIGTRGMDAQRRYSDTSQSARPRGHGSPPAPIGTGTPSMDAPGRRYSDASQSGRPRGQGATPDAAVQEVDLRLSSPSVFSGSRYRASNDSPMSQRSSRPSAGPSGFVANPPLAQSPTQMDVRGRIHFSRSASMPAPLIAPAILTFKPPAMDSDASQHAPTTPAALLQSTVNDIAVDFSKVSIWTPYTPHSPEDALSESSSPTRTRASNIGSIGHQVSSKRW